MPDTDEGEMIWRKKNQNNASKESTMRNCQRNKKRSQEEQMHLRETRKRAIARRRTQSAILQERITNKQLDVLFSECDQRILDIKQNIDKEPLIMIAPNFKNIYGNVVLDIEQTLISIPTIPLLEFLISHQNKVIYAFSNIEQQTRFTQEMCEYLSFKDKQRLLGVLKSQKSSTCCMLFDNMSCMMVCGLALSHFNNDNRELRKEEIANIYKLLTYFNGVWTYVSKKDLNNRNYLDLSILSDLPISEFKLYKNPITQIYKACVFFEFCENEAVYKEYLNAFCKDKGVKNWREYVLKIFALYDGTLKTNLYISFKENDFEKTFFEQYELADKECNLHFDDYSKFLNYRPLLKLLRDKFIYKPEQNKFLILNANLLADKLYQGLKFELFQTAKNHALLDETGKPVKSFDTFCSNYGRSFSEDKLFARTMYKIFDFADKCLVDSELRAKQIIPPSDFYLRIGSDVFVFEFKDELFNEDVKFSQDIIKIKSTIIEKICRKGNADNNGNKGAFQVLATIESILNGGWNRIEDIDIQEIKRIFPIVVTTDRAFSAMGVNYFVRDQVKNVISSLRKFSTANIYDPIIIDYDIFFAIGRSIQAREIDFAQMLHSFDAHTHSTTPLNSYVPFNTFAIDQYVHSKGYNAEDTRFFIDDIIKAF